MNLHAVVRGVIPAVNPDTSILWRQSTGFAVVNFKQIPAYTNISVKGNDQALTARELEHKALQNMEGLKRAVYLFGNAQGIVRPDAKGGDLLVFPQMRGGTPQTWLVACVLETWGVELGGWCKVAVCLQQ